MYSIKFTNLFKTLFFAVIILIHLIFNACSAGGSSGSSTSDSSNTIASPPSSVSITEDNKILTITWAAVSDATSYKVWFNTTNNEINRG